MSEHSSPVDDRDGAGPTRVRLRIALPVLAVTAAAGIAIGAAVTLLAPLVDGPARRGRRRSGRVLGPGRPARAGLHLRDQGGRAVSLASLRGKPAIITFLDPLCRNVCPLETNVLNQAVARLPTADRPAIVAISVNRWGNSRADLLEDVQRWRLGRDLALGGRQPGGPRRSLAALRHRRAGDDAGRSPASGARDHPHACLVRHRRQRARARALRLAVRRARARAGTHLASRLTASIH